MGLVVHGPEVLGHAARDGVEACAAAAGKDDAFHKFLLKGCVFDFQTTSLTEKVV